MLARHDHLGAGSNGEQVRDLSTGEVLDVVVRRKVVDARYLEASIPATHVAPFDVASGARVVPVNELPTAAQSASFYVVLGSGKTAADACIWLLGNGVEQDRIRWVRPRDAWFYDRAHFQPLHQVGAIMEGNSLDAEAGAQAVNVDDLVERLEASGRLVRIDPAWPATMFRGTMLSARELEALRQITNVVRLGRVRRIEPGRIVLERGESQTGSDVLHVDCTALGLNNAPATPIFRPGRIVLQQVRHLSPSFNAGLVGFVEAHRDSDEDKNRLCPPNPYPASIEDWPRMISRTWRTEGRWLSEPDVSAWVAQQPAQPARSPSGSPRRAFGTGGDQALSHKRQAGNPAAHPTRRIEADSGAVDSRCSIRAERTMTRRAVSSDQAPEALGPYSQAIVAGGLVFCSGMAGIDPATGTIPDGIEAQTEQALLNLAAVLAAAGASMDDVVKTTIFYADVEDFGRLNDVYARHMPDPPPARSAPAHVRLPRGLLVSIEAIAVLPSVSP